MATKQTRYEVIRKGKPVKYVMAYTLDAATKIAGYRYGGNWYTLVREVK